MQHVNKISRSTQWKDLGKSTKQNGCQVDFSKFQKHASTETSMECTSKSFIFKWYFRGNSLFWYHKILPYCQKFETTSSLEYCWVFFDSFISRGRYFQGKDNKSATRNVSVETIRLFYLLINNFKLNKFCNKNWISGKKPTIPCFLFLELMTKVKLVIWFWLHVIWVEWLSYFICSFIFDSSFQGVLYWKRKPVLITIQMTVMTTMNTPHYSEIFSLLTFILSFIVWMK